MHAMVVRGTVHDADKANAHLREQAIPALRQAPGFVSGQWVRVGGREGNAIITFETEEGAKAGAEQLRANPPPGEALTINSVEIGEVVERI
jgi:hypothetical protein